MSEDNDQHNNEQGLSKEEEDKCWEAFSAFDKEQNGYINSNELKHVLEIMEQKPSDQEIFRLISDADPNNSGKIMYNAFK